MVSRGCFRVAECMMAALVLALFAGTSCAPSGAATGSDSEAQFRKLFHSTITDRLIVCTDKHRYRQNDTIRYWVENTTDQDLWFEDQSFGVQAFAYDEAAEQWMEVDLGFRVSEPMRRAIESGGGGVLDYYALWVDRIDLPEDGKVRLVITGHTDLDISALDETYTAYTDIEVVE
jgi:hypothetical protein